MWGGTCSIYAQFLPRTNFNPPSPCGEGQVYTLQLNEKELNFNPPSPCGEGPESAKRLHVGTIFQSTLPVWGGTFVAQDMLPNVRISIHPPRVGRDNPRAVVCSDACQFQSTLPVWGGTRGHPPTRPLPGGDFNPPSPCGEGQGRPPAKKGGAGFQSTLPVWGGTETLYVQSSGKPNFNPPSPCGEGLGMAENRKRPEDFNPPSPCGEGPLIFCPSVRLFRISIHPPRVGRDPNWCYNTSTVKISIHPPRVGRDAVVFRDILQDFVISIHPPRVGRDRQLHQRGHARQNFNPPSPCGEGPLVLM